MQTFNLKSTFSLSPSSNFNSNLHFNKTHSNPPIYIQYLKHHVKFEYRIDKMNEMELDCSSLLSTWIRLRVVKNYCKSIHLFLKDI